MFNLWYNSSNFIQFLQGRIYTSLIFILKKKTKLIIWSCTSQAKSSYHRLFYTVNDFHLAVKFIVTFGWINSWIYTEKPMIFYSLTYSVFMNLYLFWFCMSQHIFIQIDFTWIFIIVFIKGQGHKTMLKGKQN